MGQTDTPRVVAVSIPSIEVKMLRADMIALEDRARRMGIDPATLAGQYIAIGLSKAVGR